MTPEQIEKWRAQFESWIKSPPYERRAIRFGESSAWPGSYASIDIDLAWQAWQECARLVAQDTWERAAQCGERWIHKHRTDALETQDEGCDFVDGAQGVINDIRAAAAREAK